MARSPEAGTPRQTIRNRLTERGWTQDASGRWHETTSSRAMTLAQAWKYVGEGELTCMTP